jgi:hypothetical protein
LRRRADGNGTTSARATTTRPSAGKIFWAAFAFFAVLGSLWALSGPPYSVADESAHATKGIAQVRGQIIGYEAEGVRYIVVDLPDGYRYSANSTCFIYQPETPADCGVEVGDEGANWFGTWVGAYNPTYYYLVGWASLIFDGPAGIYAMRIVSALVSALFLASATLAALSSVRARWMPLGVVALTSPMILYFAGSVNPQGLEVAAAAALWTGLYRLLQTWREPDAVTLSRGALWSIVGVSSIIVANVRALGPLWLVIIVVASLIIGGWRPTQSLFSTAKSYWWLGAIAIGGLFSLWWTLSGGSLSGQAEATDAPFVGGSFLTGFTQVLRLTPAYGFQAIGQFGWLDAAVPGVLVLLFCIAAAIPLFLAMVATNRRGLLIMGMLAALALFVPALVQGYSVHQTGMIWQGRYALFLYISLPLFAAIVLSSRAGTRVAFLSVRTTVLVTGLFAIYGVGAFIAVLRRYVVGNATPTAEMVTNPQWQPPLGWPVLVALTILAWVGFYAWTVHRAIVLARAETELDRAHAHSVAPDGGRVITDGADSGSDFGGRHDVADSARSKQPA